MNDVNEGELAHLQPWSNLLQSGWPPSAGPIPTQGEVLRAVALGSQLGTKVGLAWALYCRPEGATRSEIIAVCGGPHTNAATDAARQGHLEFNLKRRNDGEAAYFMGPIGSGPGGSDARPVGRAIASLPEVARSALLEAMDRFDRDFRNTSEWEGWEQNRVHKYAIAYEGRLYPVKQIMSLATGVPTGEFSGGKSRANAYVGAAGLEIVALQRGKQSLRENLESILATYLDIRTNKPFGQDPELWDAFQSVQRAVESLPEIRSRTDFKVTWSVGRGNWAQVPWVAILSERETTSTQQGVYCVFLFREDMSGVYLTLNQGITEPKNRLGPQAGLAEVGRRATELRRACGDLAGSGFNLDSEIDLRASPGRGLDYQQSTIGYKLYATGAVPDDETIEADLSAVLDAYEAFLKRKFATGPNMTRLEELKSRFLERMPGFETFPSAAADSVYAREERNYKDDLVRIFREEFSARLQAPPGDDAAEDKLAEDLHAFLRRKLPSTGKPQNLLTWRDYDFLNTLDGLKKREFVGMMRDLLYGTGTVGERIEQFTGAFGNLLSGAVQRVSRGTPGSTRVLPTFFLMVSFPETEIFVKTRPFNSAAQMIMGWPPLKAAPFDSEQYLQTSQLAAVVREALDKWGWAPRDMLDVQSFIWVVTSSGYGTQVDSHAPIAFTDSEEDEQVEDTAPSVEDYREPPFEELRRRVIDERRMLISERTLRRYHLAIKSRGFVILSGVSGTGKTWLAQAYADAVGARALLVPVAPNWTTNEDLLGFLNPLDGVYHHTDFSRFLGAAAAAHAEAGKANVEARPYHLILDEMNLARVEYYFAKFLSTMEVRARGGSAFIELAADLRVALTPNLSFIGTVNIDETTHGFADKVYDRAQLIELDGPRDLLAQHLGSAPYADVLLRVWDAVCEVAPFAYRVLDEIASYSSAAGAMGVPWQEAIDEQLLQKVLPKLKGSDPRVGDGLQMLVAVSSGTFPLTDAKAKAMIEKFQRHGYTTYF